MGNQALLLLLRGCRERGVFQLDSIAFPPNESPSVYRYLRTVFLDLDFEY